MVLWILSESISLDYFNETLSRALTGTLSIEPMSRGAIDVCAQMESNEALALTTVKVACEMPELSFCNLYVAIALSDALMECELLVLPRKSASGLILFDASNVSDEGSSCLY